MKHKQFHSLSCLSLVLAFLTLMGGHFSKVCAEAPMVKTQVPVYYRMMLGQFEITAVADGFIDLDVKLMRNDPEEKLNQLLERNFTPPPKMKTAVNCYLINTGSKLVLVDAGSGAMFGPSLGRLAVNMKAAGYDPSQVDDILITHMHLDHIGGLVDNEGKPAFPKATVHVAKAESDFWLSESQAKKAPAEMRKYFRIAHTAADPYIAAGRWKTFKGGDLPVTGIRAVPIQGHTPGHSAFEVKSGRDALMITGDMVHSMAIQFASPDAALVFDTDQKQAVSVRQKMFREAAEGKFLMAGMHMPFPGIGHIRAEGKNSYTWVPIEFSPLP